MAIQIGDDFIKFDENDINFRYIKTISDNLNEDGNERIVVEKWLYYPLSRELKRTIITKNYGKMIEEKRNRILERKNLNKFGEACNEVQNKNITNLGDEIFMEYNPKIFNSISGKKYLNGYVNNIYRNPYKKFNDKLIFFDEKLIDKDNIEELDRVASANKVIDVFKEFRKEEAQDKKDEGQEEKNEDKSNIWVIKKNRTNDQKAIFNKINKLQNMHAKENNSNKDDNIFVPIHLRKNKPNRLLNNTFNNDITSSFYDNKNNESNGFNNNSNNNGFNDDNNLIKQNMTPREKRLLKYRQMEFKNENKYVNIDNNSDINSKSNSINNINDNNDFKEKYSLKLIGFNSLEDMKPIDIVHIVKDKNINCYIKCCIPRNRKTGKNKNICFLDFNTYEEAVYAYDILNENKIRMDYAIITAEWVK